MASSTAANASTDVLAAALHDPEILAPLIHQEFVGRVVVAGSPAVRVSTELVGRPGSTVTFPRWSNLQELADVAETELLPLDKITQELSEARIKETGKAVQYTETADLVGLGNLGAEIVRQFGVLTARKVDADLITVAMATVEDAYTNVNDSTQTDSKPLSYALAEGQGEDPDEEFGWDAIVNALEEFGDDFEPGEFAGLYIRAEQRSTIMKDPVFIRASESSAGGPGSMVNRGLIGTIAGLNVYVTNRLPEDKALLLKNGALGLLYKKQPEVKTDSDIRARTEILAVNMHYATKRLNDKGVLVIDLDPK